MGDNIEKVKKLEKIKASLKDANLKKSLSEKIENLKNNKIVNK